MIDFYYWGTQCPYNYSNKLVLDQIKDSYDIEVNYFDLSNDHNLAKKLHLYSPTMTVFNKKLRWSGPISFELIEKYLQGEMLTRKPYIVESLYQEVVGELKPFLPENYKDISHLCSRGACHECSFEKSIWMTEIIDKYKSKHLGILHYKDQKCVGGVEYVPSLEVPYDIPKSKDYAFITCVFTSDPVYDFKSHPLRRLEVDLKDMGYKKVYIVASREVSFPNGSLDWFLSKGYDDLGLVYYEENDHAYQHLLEKVL